MAIPLIHIMLLYIMGGHMDSEMRYEKTQSSGFHARYLWVFDRLVLTIREERNHVFSDSGTIIDFALSADATGIFMRKRSWGTFLAWDCKQVAGRREEPYNQSSH